MASARSSAQERFANPQPAPAATSTTAPMSPPSKASLKSWWKGFRPPAKTMESNGTAAPTRPSSPALQSASSPPTFTPVTTYEDLDQQFETERQMSLVLEESGSTEHGGYLSFLPRGRSAMFKEHANQTSDDLVVGSSSEQPSAQLDEVSDRRTSVLGGRRGRMEFYPPLQRRPPSPSRIDDNSQIPISPPPISTRKRWSMNLHSTFKGWGFSTTSAETGKAPGNFSEDMSSSLQHPPLRLHTAQSSKTLFGASLTESEIPSSGIFGVPLRQSIAYANVAISLVDQHGKSYIYGYVPIVVAKCGVYLKEKATHVEGIFRLSGSEKRIKELKTVFDSPDRYGKGLDWAGYTVHDAANVLRRYLNQLPEPIVPLDLYSRFREPLRGHTMQAMDGEPNFHWTPDFTLEDAIKVYQQLITELPPLNRQLLLYILDLLAVFASKADENRMNAMNLSAIFQPGMLSHPQHDMAPEEYRLSQDVLIFLIENQDHFLIGMRGTAADEKTVQEVQSGGTPPPGTPSTPTTSRLKNALNRSSSSASAGADSIRKFGGVRRNVSVSSRGSRQSNGAPSPASPAFVPSLPQATSGSMHRSNTVPSKKSPGLPSNRRSPRGLSPATPTIPPAKRSMELPPTNEVDVVPNSVLSSQAISEVPSNERLLPRAGETHVETGNPSRSVSNIFQRGPASESDRKTPNKLRKKRVTSGSGPSAHSSVQSLNHIPGSSTVSPLLPARNPQDKVEMSRLDNSLVVIPQLQHTVATPPLHEGPRRAERPPPLPTSLTPAQEAQLAEHKLQPLISPVSSLHSHSSMNDLSQSDLDPETGAARQNPRKKRSRWSRSRPNDPSKLAGTISPIQGLGTDKVVGASSSTVGSAKPSKVHTSDTLPASSDATLVGAHQHATHDSGHTSGEEGKKSPFGWIRKFREKRDKSGDEKRDDESNTERNKSPSSSSHMTNDSVSHLPHAMKSPEIKPQDRPKAGESLKPEEQPQAEEMHKSEETLKPEQKQQPVEIRPSEEASLPEEKLVVEEKPETVVSETTAGESQQLHS